MRGKENGGRERTWNKDERKCITERKKEARKGGKMKRTRSEDKESSPMTKGMKLKRKVLEEEKEEQARIKDLKKKKYEERIHI